MRVKVKKLVDGAIVPFKTYSEDFCYDVVATSCEEVAPNVYKYGIGLAFEMVVDDEKQFGGFNYSIDFRPRSSVWKTGMVLSNCEGTIDELFHSEVSAVFYHLFPNMPRYEIGDKIGQIKIGKTEKMLFEIVDELTETGRGGYGSTGLKVRNNGT